METEFADDVRDRMAYEAARVEPPDDFPQLPDLPVARYLDERLFQAEVDQVFRKSWLFVGHASDLGPPGSFLSVDIAFAPVVITKDRDGEIRAFHNACRHRGARLARQRCGAAKLLVCGFHGWAYDLAGKLVKVTEERDFRGVNRGERGLLPVRCETWGEFLFINLNPDAPALREDFRPLVHHYSDLMEWTYRPVRSMSWDVECNWKVAVEAFLEGYHLTATHPQTAAPFLQPGGTAEIIFENRHSVMFVPYRPDVVAAAGPEAIELFHPSDCPQVEHVPSLYTESNMSFHAFPNTIVPSDVAGFPIITFWPQSVTKTKLKVDFYGTDWGDGHPPLSWERRIASFDVVLGEDISNLAGIQQSINAAPHTGMPLSYQERRIWKFHSDLVVAFGPERIDPALRIPELLSHYVESSP